MNTPPRVAIVGAGRVGCALHAALSEAGRAPLLLWTRSEATAAEARGEGFPATSGPVPAALSQADIVLLAVRDDAIGAAAADLAGSGLVQPGATCAHHAGSLGLDVLAPLAPAAHLGSLHLLVSVPSRRGRLAGAYGAVEASDDAALEALSSVAAAIGVTPVRVAGDRARYHAAACLVGNYPQVLVEAALRLLADSGLGRAEARRMLAPLMQSAVRNALEKDGAASLSGPIARGDAGVVAGHLAAMRRDEALATTAAAYRALGRIANELAAGPGRDAVARALGEE